MKKLLFVCLLIVNGFTAAFSQTSQDSIYFKKVSGGYEFIKNDIPLTINQLCSILENDPDTKHDVRVAKLNEGFGTFFCYMGGFCIGYALGDMIFGHNAGKADLVLGGSGVASAVVGFLFFKGSSNRLQNAANIYNSNLGKTAIGDVSLNFGLTPSGIGLTLYF